MTAPLIFVRDGRTLPFVPVTTAALRAIRERCVKRPYATATYMALLELANEDRTDRIAVTQRLLVDRVGASRSTVQGALADLQGAGLLKVVERTHGGGRIENEYVVIEPEGDRAESDTPARDTGDPRPSGEQLSQEEEKKSPPDRDRDRASTAVDEFPEDLPEQLHDTAVAVGKVLKRTALQRAQKKEVTRAAVGQMLLTYPDRPHEQVAREVEYWLLHGKGARKSCADIVQRYGNFLRNSEPAAGPPLPEGVTPIASRPRAGGRMSNADTVEASIQALRAAGQAAGSAPASDTFGSA